MQQQEALFVEDINASDKSTFILDLNPVSIKAQIMPLSMRNVKTNIRNALSQKKTNLQDLESNTYFESKFDELHPHSHSNNHRSKSQQRLISDQSSFISSGEDRGHFDYQTPTQSEHKVLFKKDVVTYINHRGRRLKRTVSSYQVS